MYTADEVELAVEGSGWEGEVTGWEDGEVLQASRRTACHRVT